MNVYERLRASEQSRRLAWQILPEIRQVLEILGDQRIPYEGEMKRFRAEGDFLLRAMTDLISQCRSQIHQLGQDFEELQKLAGERELPRDVLQSIHHMAGRQRALGLSETELRERLNKLQELHILPEHRGHPACKIRRTGLALGTRYLDRPIKESLWRTWIDEHSRSHQPRPAVSA